MADNDDDRGKKDNTGQEHKPDHAQANENAPTGNIGTNRTFGPSLGMGGIRQARNTTHAAEQTQQTGKSQQQDTRDVFPETNDPEVNAHHQKAERMISKDDPQHPDNAQKKAEGPRVSQSDFAKAFRQASAKTQSMQRSRGIDHD